MTSSEARLEQNTHHETKDRHALTIGSGMHTRADESVRHERKLEPGAGGEVSRRAPGGLVLLADSRVARRTVCFLPHGYDVFTRPPAAPARVARIFPDDVRDRIARASRLPCRSEARGRAAERRDDLRGDVRG